MGECGLHGMTMSKNMSHKRDIWRDGQILRMSVRWDMEGGIYIYDIYPHVPPATERDMSGLSTVRGVEV